MNFKFILGILVLFGLSFAALSISDWSVSQDSFTPGATGLITVEVSNPCTISSNLVSCTGVDTVNSVKVDFFTASQITMAGSQQIGDIEPGGSTRISLPFKISENAKSAIYEIEVLLSGFSGTPGESGGFSAFSRRLSVPITVVQDPIFTLSIDHPVIGGIDPISLTISNQGGSATDLYISISDTSDVAFYGSDEIYLPSIDGEAVINLTLDSRDSSDGPTNVPIMLNYKNELGILDSDNISMRLTVRNKKLDLTFIQSTEIVTRQEGILTLQVTNDGEETLSDMRLVFSDAGLRLKDKNEFKFGDLKPGETSSASVVVFADFSPGVNLLDASITWIEKDVQKDESRKIPIAVTSDAEVGIYLEAKPLPLVLDSEHTISVLVSNLGSYPIENVEVSISSPAIDMLDISDRQYIGGLQQDDFSTVQFQTKINASEEGMYPVEVIIKYRDASGEWKHEIIERSITVHGQQTSEDSLLPLGALIVVTGIIVWYFKFRKPKVSK